jgi:hypothetical protein
VVVELAWATLRLPLPELAVNDASPAKLALTAPVYEFAATQPAIGHKLVAEVVARPTELVVALVVIVLPSAVTLKLIVIPLTPVAPAFSVAVNVPVPPYVPAPLTSVSVVACAADTVTVKELLLVLKSDTVGAYLAMRTLEPATAGVYAAAHDAELALTATSGQVPRPLAGMALDQVP